MDEIHSEVRDRLFGLRSVAAASPTGSITISVEVLNEVDYAAKKLEQQIASLQQRVEALMTDTAPFLDHYKNEGEIHLGLLGPLMHTLWDVRRSLAAA